MNLETDYLLYEESDEQNSFTLDENENYCINILKSLLFDNSFTKETEDNSIIKEKNYSHSNGFSSEENNEIIAFEQNKLKRKRGRRPLSGQKNRKDIIHKKSDKDNVIYKIKTTCFKSIITFL